MIRLLLLNSNPRGSVSGGRALGRLASFQQNEHSRRCVATSPTTASSTDVGHLNRRQLQRATSTSAHPRMNRSSRFIPPSPLRPEETQEIVQKFFRDQGEGGRTWVHRTLPDRRPAQRGERQDALLSSTTSTTPNSLNPPTSTQEKYKAEILSKFFSKGRPESAYSVPQEAPAVSPANRTGLPRPHLSPLPSSKLAQLLKQDMKSQQQPLPGPVDNFSNTIVTDRSVSPPVPSNQSTSLRPRFSIRRPLLQNQQQQLASPTPLPRTNKSDPSDVSKLRLALFGDKKRRTTLPPIVSKSSVSLSAIDTSGAANPTPMSSLSSLKAPSTTDFDSTLSNFIRRIQIDQAKRAAAEQAAREAAMSDSFHLSPPPPLPLWRMTEGRLHVGLRNHRSQSHNHAHQERQMLDRSSFFRQDGEEARNATKPVFVDHKEQVVMLPPFPVTLAEASLLLREKTRRLRRLLRDIGGVFRLEGADHAKRIMIDPDTMELLALELGRKFEKIESSPSMSEEQLLLQRRAESVAAAAGACDTLPWESLPPRPPVVCLLGHVDHGKTTLMDALRRRSQQLQNGDIVKKKKKDKSGNKVNPFVAGTEAGGITQVISAFQVPLTANASESQQNYAPAVTFLDTPGHAAFKAMRQSGSDAADIIVLVVAADDGVSAQTIEILNFYKSIVKGAGHGGISLVVAMNKIDKPGVDLEESRRRIESQLLEHRIVVEGTPHGDDSEFGPPVQMIPVSGLTGQGIDDLIDGLMLQAEVMDLRADENARAEGIVMDARVDKGLGNVVDCIIRWGSIENGDVVVSGTSMGRVRILKDMTDKPTERGLPSQPVRIVGFDSLPKAGDSLVCVESEEAANDLISRRMTSATDELDVPISSADAELQSSGRHMMHEVWKDALEEKYGLDSDENSGVIIIPVIVKADADGTLAAIRDALLEIGVQSRHNVVIEPIKVGVGPVLATEIQLAKESGAVIVSFNLKNEQSIVRMAEDEGIALLGNKVIYNLIDRAREEFAKYLPALPVEVVHGRAEVQAIYEIGGLADKVAGLRVSEGKLYRAKTESKVEIQFRVLRNGKVISIPDLRATSLKHFKEDVDEISRGKDCGLSLAGYNDFQTGDVIECFSIEMKKEFV